MEQGTYEWAASMDRMIIRRGGISLADDEVWVKIAEAASAHADRVITLSESRGQFYAGKEANGDFDTTDHEEGGNPGSDSEDSTNGNDVHFHRVSLYFVVFHFQPRLQVLRHCMHTDFKVVG